MSQTPEITRSHQAVRVIVQRAATTGLTFKLDNPSIHGQWMTVRTYGWIPPRPPVPQTRRRMLRRNAFEAKCCDPILES